MSTRGMHAQYPTRGPVSGPWNAFRPGPTVGGGSLNAGGLGSLARTWMPTPEQLIREDRGLVMESFDHASYLRSFPHVVATFLFLMLKTQRWATKVLPFFYTTSSTVTYMIYKGERQRISRRAERTSARNVSTGFAVRQAHTERIGAMIQVSDDFMATPEGQRKLEMQFAILDSSMKAQIEEACVIVLRDAGDVHAEAVVEQMAPNDTGVLRSLRADVARFDIVKRTEGWFYLHTLGVMIAKNYGITFDSAGKGFWAGVDGLVIVWEWLRGVEGFDKFNEQGIVGRPLLTNAPANDGQTRRMRGLPVFEADNTLDEFQGRRINPLEMQAWLGTWYQIGRQSTLENIAKYTRDRLVLDIPADDDTGWQQIAWDEAIMATRVWNDTDGAVSAKVRTIADTWNASLSKEMGGAKGYAGIYSSTPSVFPLVSAGPVLTHERGIVVPGADGGGLAMPRTLGAQDEMALSQRVIEAHAETYAAALRTRFAFTQDDHAVLLSAAKWQTSLCEASTEPETLALWDATVRSSGSDDAGMLLTDETGGPRHLAPWRRFPSSSVHDPGVYLFARLPNDYSAGGLHTVGYDETTLDRSEDRVRVPLGSHYLGSSGQETLHLAFTAAALEAVIHRGSTLGVNSSIVTSDVPATLWHDVTDPGAGNADALQLIRSMSAKVVVFTTLAELLDHSTIERGYYSAIDLEFAYKNLTALRGMWIGSGAGGTVSDETMARCVKVSLELARAGRLAIMRAALPGTRDNRWRASTIEEVITAGPVRAAGLATVGCLRRLSKLHSAARGSAGRLGYDDRMIDELGGLNDALRRLASAQDLHGGQTNSLLCTANLPVHVRPDDGDDLDGVSNMLGHWSALGPGRNAFFWERPPKASSGTALADHYETRFGSLYFALAFPGILGGSGSAAYGAPGGGGASPPAWTAKARARLFEVTAGPEVTKAALGLLRSLAVGNTFKSLCYDTLVDAEAGATLLDTSSGSGGARARLFECMFVPPNEIKRRQDAGVTTYSVAEQRDFALRFVVGGCTHDQLAILCYVAQVRGGTEPKMPFGVNALSVSPPEPQIAPSGALWEMIFTSGKMARSTRAVAMKTYTDGCSDSGVFGHPGGANSVKNILARVDAVAASATPDADKPAAKGAADMCRLFVAMNAAMQAHASERGHSDDMLGSMLLWLVFGVYANGAEIPEAEYTFTPEWIAEFAKPHDTYTEFGDFLHKASRASTSSTQTAAAARGGGSSSAGARAIARLASLFNRPSAMRPPALRTREGESAKNVFVFLPGDPGRDGTRAILDDDGARLDNQWAVAAQVIPEVFDRIVAARNKDNWVLWDDDGDEDMPSSTSPVDWTIKPYSRFLAYKDALEKLARLSLAAVRAAASVASTAEDDATVSAAARAAATRITRGRNGLTEALQEFAADRVAADDSGVVDILAALERGFALSSLLVRDAGVVADWHKALNPTGLSGVAGALLDCIEDALTEPQGSNAAERDLRAAGAAMRPALSEFLQAYTLLERAVSGDIARAAAGGGRGRRKVAEDLLGATTGGGSGAAAARDAAAEAAETMAAMDADAESAAGSAGAAAGTGAGGFTEQPPPAVPAAGGGAGMPPMPPPSGGAAHSRAAPGWGGAGAGAGAGAGSGAGAGAGAGGRRPRSGSLGGAPGGAPGWGTPGSTRTGFPPPSPPHVPPHVPPAPARGARWFVSAEPRSGSLGFVCTRMVSTTFFKAIKDRAVGLRWTHVPIRPADPTNPTRPACVSNDVHLDALQLEILCADTHPAGSMSANPWSEAIPLHIGIGQPAARSSSTRKRAHFAVFGGGAGAGGDAMDLGQGAGDYRDGGDDDDDGPDPKRRRLLGGGPSSARGAFAGSGGIAERAADAFDAPVPARYGILAGGGGGGGDVRNPAELLAADLVLAPGVWRLPQPRIDGLRRAFGAHLPGSEVIVMDAAHLALARVPRSATGPGTLGARLVPRRWAGDHGIPLLLLARIVDAKNEGDPLRRTARLLLLQTPTDLGPQLTMYHNNVLPTFGVTIIMCWHSVVTGWLLLGDGGPGLGFCAYSDPMTKTGTDAQTHETTFSIIMRIGPHVVNEFRLLHFRNAIMTRFIGGTELRSDGGQGASRFATNEGDLSRQNIATLRFTAVAALSPIDSDEYVKGPINLLGVLAPQSAKTATVSAPGEPMRNVDGVSGRLTYPGAAFVEQNLAVSRAENLGNVYAHEGSCFEMDPFAGTRTAFRSGNHHFTGFGVGKRAQGVRQGQMVLYPRTQPQSRDE